jgi:predicted SnoaL-like aldol condensation-catalyzing enzyme
MKKIIFLAAITLFIFACNNQSEKAPTQAPETSETKTDISNKEKAVALLRSLETGDQTPVGYINPNKYIQHNLTVADGLEGFGAVLQNAPEGGFKVNVVRSFQDGDYVFTHTIYDFFGPKVGFDIFKFEDGKITEHWDNLTEIAVPNPSGRTQTDGATEITDLARTKGNKEIVKDFINWVLIEGHYDEMTNYFEGNAYIQHNPTIADGLNKLGKAMQDMAKQGTPMVYEKNHIVLGEGNFVLAVSEGTFGGKPTSFYDLFRMQNNLIVEHWDVIEAILPEAERKNSNGKFNFK